MPPTTCLDLLDPTRRTILVTIRRLGFATVQEVAARTFLSEGAARQHLQSLEAQGLLAHEPERSGPGRPRHRFTLTPRGEALFPRADHEALQALLLAVREEDPALRQRLVQRIAARAIQHYRPTFEREASHSPLRALVAIFEEAGYIPELTEAPAGTAFVLHHCPVAAAHRLGGLICDAEQQCLEAALPRHTIHRIASRPTGDATCAYLLEPGDS